MEVDPVREPRPKSERDGNAAPVREGPEEKLGPPVPEPVVGSMLMVADSVLNSLPNIFDYYFVILHSNSLLNAQVLLLLLLLLSRGCKKVIRSQVSEIIGDSSSIDRFDITMKEKHVESALRRSLILSPTIEKCYCTQ